MCVCMRERYIERMRWITREKATDKERLREIQSWCYLQSLCFLVLDWFTHIAQTNTTSCSMPSDIRVQIIGCGLGHWKERSFLGRRRNRAEYGTVKTKPAISGFQSLCLSFILALAFAFWLWLFLFPPFSFSLTLNVMCHTQQACSFSQPASPSLTMLLSHKAFWQIWVQGIFHSGRKVLRKCCSSTRLSKLSQETPCVCAELLGHKRPNVCSHSLLGAVYWPVWKSEMTGKK